MQPLSISRNWNGLISNNSLQYRASELTIVTDQATCFLRRTEHPASSVSFVLNSALLVYKATLISPACRYPFCLRGLFICFVRINFFDSTVTQVSSTAYFRAFVCDSTHNLYQARKQFIYYSMCIITVTISF
jgi:hypothetical protein